MGRVWLDALPLALSICCGMTAQVAPEFAGFTPAELFILALPIVSYGLFNIVRDKVNPKATLSDFFLIVATLVILGNIFSILVLKARACVCGSTLSRVAVTLWLLVLTLD